MKQQRGNFLRKPEEDGEERELKTTKSKVFGQGKQDLFTGARTKATEEKAGK